jgi:hypothetical protein
MRRSGIARKIGKRGASSFRFRRRGALAMRREHDRATIAPSSMGGYLIEVEPQKQAITEARERLGLWFWIAALFATLAFSLLAGEP